MDEKITAAFRTSWPAPRSCVGISVWVARELGDLRAKSLGLPASHFFVLFSISNSSVVHIHYSTLLALIYLYNTNIYTAMELFSVRLINITGF